VPLSYSLKELRKMQRRATIWILEVFHTSSSFGIETITGLILIHLYLQKLSNRFQLRVHTLPSNHIIKSLLESRYMNDNKVHWLLLERLTLRQQLNIKGSIVDMNNRINKVFSSFDLFNSKFSPRDRLIDIFPNCFSFHSTNRKSEDSIKAYICKLDETTL